MLGSRELVDGLIRRGNYDRVGLYDHFWPETTTVWLDQGYPYTVTEENGIETRHPADPAVYFEFDMLGAGGWFDVNPIRGYSEVMEETDEWRVTRNGAGAALKYWKHKSGTPEHIDFKMVSREVWESDYKPYLLEVDRERINIENARETLKNVKAAGKWSFYGHMFIWETMRQSMGDICMYESMALDPGWIKDYNQTYTDFFKTYFNLLLTEAGIPDGAWVYEDLGYRNGLVVSPKTLEKLVFPYYAELVQLFNAHSMPVVLHSCGGITQALPLIVDAGFVALNPMEVKAGCDIFDMADKYGDRLAFIGGLDIRLLETNDRSIIRESVVRLINGMKERGARFMFGSDHSITPLVKYDSYRYALEVYRENMVY